MKWIEVVKAAPVLNCPDFSSVFGGASGVDIPLNQNGHPESYEFVALPGMCFVNLAQVSPTIFQIQAAEFALYPLYIDIRFCHLVNQPKKKEPIFFRAEHLLQQMEKRLGMPYVWGGNWAAGIPDMLKFYPPAKKLPPRIEELWTFRGLDCSGLLFEAAQGSTPRNSSALVTYGKPLETLSLRPMDMIVYPGHVLFVRDDTTIIESKAGFGVRLQPLQKRWDEIEAEKKFVQVWENGQFDAAGSFTIRRFCAQ